jgi:DNA repair protein RadC
MFTEHEEKVLAEAASILEIKLKNKDMLTNLNHVKSYCQLLYAGLEHEIFVLLALDSKSRLIEEVRLFRGAFDHLQVYPREVLKEALKLNAVGAILVHNHPSGEVQPSKADKKITNLLFDTFKIVDICLYDHIIVSKYDTFSFFENNLLPK